MASTKKKATPVAAVALPRPWHLAERAMSTAGTLLLHGLPGTGKTFATLNPLHPAGEVAAEDCYALTLHGDSSPSDLIGGYLPIEGVWTWRDGPAVLAWRASHERPVRLILNELDRAAGETHTALLAILDAAATARLTLPTGETVRPHWDAAARLSHLQVVSTMNGSPKDLDEALLDRHEGTVRLDEPHPASIASLPEDLQAVAAGLTTAHERATGRGTTPRDWHAFAALRSRGLLAEDAGELVWGERSRDVLAHLAILAVPGAEVAGVCEHCESDECSDSEPCTDRVIASAIDCADGEYRSPSTGARYDSLVDSDGDSYDPHAGQWQNAEAARVSE